MIRLALRELVLRRWRAAMTSLAVVVGVGVVSGTLIVGDTAERAGTRDSDIDQVSQILFAAGAVALLVGAFIINITMSVVLAQRSRELALLRCLGATPKQLRRTVRLESFAIGAVGSVAGLILGFGFAFAFRALINTAWFPADLTGRTLVATPRTVVAALLVGCVVTLLSAHAPARRASRVPPLAAVRDDPASPRRGGMAWTLAGSVVATAALAVVLFAALTYTGPLLLLGGALALVGMRMLGPRLVPVLASVVGLPLARALPLSGALGRQNATRNPERSSATASALMIGLALATFVTVLGTSTKAYIEAQLDRYQVDFELRMDQPNSGGKSAPQAMSPDLVRRLGALPQLGAVVPVTGTGDATVAGEQAGVEAVDMAGLAQVLDVDVSSGSLAALSAGGIGMSADAAAAHGWGIGSPVAVGLPGGTRTFTVQVMYGENDDSYVPYTPPRFLVTPADYVRLGGDPAPYSVLVKAADGVPLGTAEAAIQRTVAAYPGVGVHAGSERAQHDLDMIDRAMRVYLALTGLAIMVGLFGIVNVLALSVVERRRELGLLRAIGMDRRQVRSMIRAEAVIIAVVGAVLGIGLGTFLRVGGGSSVREVLIAHPFHRAGGDARDVRRRGDGGRRGCCRAAGAVGWQGRRSRRRHDRVAAVGSEGAHVVALAGRVGLPRCGRARVAAVLGVRAHLAAEHRRRSGLAAGHRRVGRRALGGAHHPEAGREPREQLVSAGCCRRHADRRRRFRQRAHARRRSASRRCGRDAFHSGGGWPGAGRRRHPSLVVPADPNRDPRAGGPNPGGGACTDGGPPARLGAAGVDADPETDGGPRPAATGPAYRAGTARLALRGADSRRRRLRVRGACGGGGGRGRICRCGGVDHGRDVSVGRPIACGGGRGAEAMTNAAKHADVRRVSVYAEVAEAEVFALIRDRGRGFDLGMSGAPDRRGIADSIKGRVRQQGGLAAVRSTPGEGTEVELRMPLAAADD